MHQQIARSSYCVHCREFNYAKFYCDSLHDHFKGAVLDNMPKKFTDINSQAGGDQVLHAFSVIAAVICEVFVHACSSCSTCSSL
jgi:hypothetical protein